MSCSHASNDKPSRNSIEEHLRIGQSWQTHITSEVINQLLDCDVFAAAYSEILYVSNHKDQGLPDSFQGAILCF